MQTYPIPMVPGPVKVPQQVLDAMQVNYGSGDLEPEFLELYNQTEEALKKIYGTRSTMVIQTGEGMLALWSALKSMIKPGDRVFSVSTGVFGFGIGEMARSIGADVRIFELPFDQTIGALDAIEAQIADFKPKMITAVHCETPSGTLNPLAGLGALKEKYNVPLFYVDAVASAGGAPVLADVWKIDLCLGGSQKALAVPPSLSFLTVSERAWEIAAQVGYQGYDALLPFKTAQKDFYFPYTPDWQGIAGLFAGAQLLLEEGLENVFARHASASAECQRRIQNMGLALYPQAGAVNSPTVTAVKVPEQINWAELDRRFRKEGLVVGGSYGPLANKVFRLGHMGPQAEPAMVKAALDVIEHVTKAL
jgi:aspartate aminotransferase-like enzyme